MSYAFLLVSCVVFIELFIALDLRQQAADLIARSREAMSVVMSSTLDDEAKEAAVRRASVDIFKATFVFAFKFLIIVIVLYAIFWLLVTLIPDLKSPILESFVSPLVIIGLTVAAMSYAWVRNAVLK